MYARPYIKMNVYDYITTWFVENLDGLYIYGFALSFLALHVSVKSHRTFSVVKASIACDLFLCEAFAAVLIPSRTD